MSVWGGLLSPVPMSTAGDALGIWLDKPHPWWLLPSFQDACLSPTLLAWILLLLNLLLSAHDNIVTRATYKATQLLSFSPWPWHTSLYLQYLQPPSDLLSRGPDPLGFELSILKYIYIYMFSSVWQRSQRLSLKLYHCFHYCLLVFFLPSKSYFSSPPEELARHLKDKAVWGCSLRAAQELPREGKGSRMAVTEHTRLLPSISPCSRHIWNESIAGLRRVPLWVLLNL